MPRTLAQGAKWYTGSASWQMGPLAQLHGRWDHRLSFMADGSTGSASWQMEPLAQLQMPDGIGTTCFVVIHRLLLHTLPDYIDRLITSHGPQALAQLDVPLQSALVGRPVLSSGDHTLRACKGGGERERKRVVSAREARGCNKMGK